MAQDANASLECQVVSRMEAGDHWLIYASVAAGKLLNENALTAVHHRKVGARAAGGAGGRHGVLVE